MWSFANLLNEITFFITAIFSHWGEEEGAGIWAAINFRMSVNRNELVLAYTDLELVLWVEGELEELLLGNARESKKRLVWTVSHDHQKTLITGIFLDMLLRAEIVTASEILECHTVLALLEGIEWSNSCGICVLWDDLLSRHKGDEGEDWSFHNVLFIILIVRPLKYSKFLTTFWSILGYQEIKLYC